MFISALSSVSVDEGKVATVLSMSPKVLGLLYTSKRLISFTEKSFNIGVLW